MNDDFPRLTRGGFDMMAVLITGGYPGRISINPFSPAEYSYDGDRVSTKMIDKLVEQGYLSPSPLSRPIYLDVTEQARSLACRTCHGTGSTGRTDDEDPCVFYGRGDMKRCPTCSGRRIIAPGTDHTPPYEAPVKRPTKSQRREKMHTRWKAEDAARDPSPTTPGLYWLALSDGRDWLPGSPFLARVSQTETSCGLGASVSRYRVTSLDLIEEDAAGWSLQPHESASLDDDPAEALHHFRHHSIHRITRTASIGGFAAGPTCEEVRLTWLDRVHPPALPEEVDAVEG